MLFKLLCIFVCITFLASPVIGASTIPIESFVQLPDVEQVKLSPSGNKLAMLKRVMVEGSRKLVVEVTDLNTGKKSYPVIRQKNEFDISEIIWASDRHILLKIDFFKQLKRENTGWNPTIVERRLMVVDLEKNSLNNIISKIAFKRFEKKGWQPQMQDKIVDMLPDEPNYILHALDWNAKLSPRVFKVNLTTLQRTAVKSQEHLWDDWIADKEGNVRIATEKKQVTGGAERNRTQYRVHVKDLKSGKWNVLWEYSFGDKNAVIPLGFTSDPNTLLVEADHNGRDAIFEVDLQNPTKKTLFYSVENKNVGGTLFYSNLTNNPVGYHTVSGISFWDDKYEAFDRSIDKALPKTKNYLTNLSMDETKYLVYSQSDTDSGTYYLGDRVKKTLKPIAYKYMGLDPTLMSTSKRYMVPARDGQKVEVFLTQPQNSEEKALPTIIYSNHGNGAAAVGGFDYRTQYLVSRGYNVVQVNFRKGTGGYYKFMAGGIDQWGDQLYQDLDDVLAWGIREKYISSNKVCLMGERYAGYAALMAVAKGEGDYKCVVTFGAMTDIHNQVLSTEGYTHHEKTKQRLSNKSKIQKKYSVTSYAKDFDSASLLIHGTSDSNIRFKQSAMLNKALKRSKKNVEYIEIKDEESTLTTDESRLRVYKQVDSFLKQYL